MRLQKQFWMSFEGVTAITFTLNGFHMRLNWQCLMSLRARKYNRHPEWLIDRQWEPLKVYWQTSEFVVKLVARASQKCGSLHTTGARSQGHVTREMINPQKKKNKTDEDVWVEPRAKDTYVTNHVNGSEEVCGKILDIPCTKNHVNGSEEVSLGDKRPLLLVELCTHVQTAYEEKIEAVLNDTEMISLRTKGVSLKE
ncbi:hypothetical protein RND71_010956 [Anisodus tanguticus]|uniref:Uncharacterized protein n=1 Tax=Anisodus tanguticus TaxID=243964 RepID=A0AAE1SMN2_9SOLA|nr:hypothetical protein RND71_010956 [Anisodus tanguticus]